MHSHAAVKAAILAGSKRKRVVETEAGTKDDDSTVIVEGDHVMGDVYRGDRVLGKTYTVHHGAAPQVVESSSSSLKSNKPTSTAGSAAAKAVVADVMAAVGASLTAAGISISGAGEAVAAGKPFALNLKVGGRIIQGDVVGGKVIQGNKEVEYFIDDQPVSSVRASKHGKWAASGASAAAPASDPKPDGASTLPSKKC